MLDTPVLFLIFNRPDLTAQVLAQIRAAAPKKLFVAADGPRSERPGEALLCDQARKLVMDGVDWDCGLHTLFREDNLGCKLAVSGAIDWFFENVEEGIILEDDCLPDLSFFRFCEEMLERYREDEAVMHIGGSSFLDNPEFLDDGDYYFSNFSHIWGWATWRRAWSKYDVDIKWWPENKDWVCKVLPDEKFEEYWQNAVESVYKGSFNTWDMQWNVQVWKEGGKCIIPKYNLVKNMGFRTDATHTTTMPDYSVNEVVQDFTLYKSPKNQDINTAIDIRSFYKLYYRPPVKIDLMFRIKWHTRRLFRFFKR